MRYKGFYAKITPDENILREDNNCSEVICSGFSVEIFSDESESIRLDKFDVAVGFELLSGSIDEAEQLIKDYIDCEEKEWCREINSTMEKGVIPMC